MNNKHVSYRIPLIGALFGLVIISLFVFSEQQPRPEWGEYWRVRPLLLTPFCVGMGVWAGASVFAGGKGGYRILRCILAGLIVFVSIWLGIVLGLDGTLWD